MSFLKQKPRIIVEFTFTLKSAFFSDLIDMIFFFISGISSVSLFFPVEIPCSQVIRDFEAEYYIAAWASELGVLVTVELLSLRLYSIKS